MKVNNSYPKQYTFYFKMSLIITFKINKISLNHISYLIVATYLGLTRPSSDNNYLIQITELHELHVNIFTCYNCMSSMFKNIRLHFTHAIFLLRRP
jgi:hypothetical protein